MGDDLLPELGDLVFSMLIGYAGALEFLYVLRHLYHWTCDHATSAEVSAANLKRVQDRLRNELVEAADKEQLAGTNVMQDGVLYKDGFRIDSQPDVQNSTDSKYQRRKEIEAELKRQKEIEEQTRKALEKAEAELIRQRAQEEENTCKLLEAERLREEEERNRELARAQVEVEAAAKRKLEEERETTENARRQREIEEERLAAEEQERIRREHEEEEKRMLEAERQYMETQRQREIAEAEEAAKQVAVEEEQRRKEEDELDRQLLEAERQRVDAEREKEMAEAEEAVRLIEEQQQEEQQQEEEKYRQEEKENERELLEAEQQRETEEMQREITEAEEQENEIQHSAEQRKNQKTILASEHELKDADALRREAEERAIEQSLLQMLDAESDRQLNLEQQEQERALIEAEREFENRQRVIEENAKKFLEADQEMEELQQRMLEASEQQPAILQRRLSATESTPQTPVFEEPCVRKTISPLSDDTSPPSTSERVTQTVKTQFGQTSDEPYSVTTKPLLFKSISDDTSSIEPPSTLSTQQSEEFIIDTDDTPTNTIDIQRTQLEREEPEGEDTDQTTLQQYTDDYLRSLDGIKQRPLTREDGSGRRRAFKKRRSSGSSNSSHGSREEEVKMFTSLEEEELRAKNKEDNDFAPIKYTTEPLLKVKSHRRRHKRSPAKDMKPSDGSIRSSLEMLNEENINPWGEMPPEHYKDMPFWQREKSMSIDEEQIVFDKPSIEGETEIEKEAGAKNVPKTASFEDATHTQNEEAITVLQKQQTNEDNEKDKDELKIKLEESVGSDKNPNLQNTQSIETCGGGGRSATSPRLRRSPRIDEMDHYEERWMETTEGATATSAAAQTPTTQHTPSIIIHNATDNASWRDQHGLMMEGLSDFYDFTASTNPSRSRSTSRQVSPSSTQPNTPSTENVAFVPTDHDEERDEKNVVDVYDDTGSLTAGEVTKKNIVEFIESLQDDCTELSQILVVADQLKNVADTPNSSKAKEEETGGDAAEMSLLVQTLRVARGRSRSRSRSPLPTNDNLERSLENRRNKMIKHNDELFEKLNVAAENVTMSELRAEKDASLNSPEEDVTRESMNALVASLRLERTRSTSQTSSPLPNQTSLESDLDNSKGSRLKNMAKLKLAIPNPSELQNANESTTSEIETSSGDGYVAHSLSRSRSRTRSRSRSPLPTSTNLERSLETRRQKLIQQNDALFEKLHITVNAVDDNSHNDMKDPKALPPIISVECCDEPESANVEDTDYSREEMTKLIESLRQRRSRSRSPMCQMERERTPEPLSAKESVQDNSDEERERRSQSPSRSNSASPSRSEPESLGDYYDFHMMLNLEATPNKTLSKCTEEMETLLAEKQRLVDQDALHKLSTANEEMELRTVTPTDMHDPQGELKGEEPDLLGVMPVNERMRQLRCSPTTPDYDRTISSEWRDVQRIKEEMISSGFKRSTYVGESLDLGSEFEPLREATARFQRSRTPSPSYIDSVEVMKNATERREIQNQILSELIIASGKVAEEDRLGAKPKEARSLSKEFQESHYDEMRRINAEFQRSCSQSRSPFGEVKCEEEAKIEAEAIEREQRDERLDGVEKTSVNFHEFSRYLNAGFLDNERRASDSALIQKPEVLTQYQDFEVDLDMEPEDYHHFRRFSLNQEQSVEEYPNDDYVYVSQIEVQTPNGTRTWIREDYYSQHFEKLNIISEESSLVGAVSIEEIGEGVEQQVRGEEDETDGSEDERQTVVEVDDEIDEDICDFNERGPADESHHDTSECEEAEREMDHYADRDANDWREIENINVLLEDESNLAAAEEGAVGGIVTAATPAYDSDSVAIDQIYDEAIKNRKQSGILRDYDSILLDMQRNYAENSTTDSSEADMGAKGDSDRYDIWAKARQLEKHEKRQKKGVDPTCQLIENEQRETELRYLGDASINARQSTRLRSRYGYVPLLHSNAIDDLEVDLNYKPKKEYNWRKNFKLEDDGEGDVHEGMTRENNDNDVEAHGNGTLEEDGVEWRKYSLGGESITLFTRSPDRDDTKNTAEAYSLDDNMVLEQIAAADMKKQKNVEHDAVAGAVDGEEFNEKPKKKKSKKKLRKETKKESVESYAKDEDDSESQIYSRRSSSLQMETDSPKRKSRSRRGSKSSITNEDAPGSLFSYRNSVSNTETLGEMNHDHENLDTNTTATTTLKKKTKKRKKVKDAFATEPDITEERTSDMLEKLLEVDVDLARNVLTASAAITPNTASINPLATLSPQNSINSVATPGSIDSVEAGGAQKEAATEPEQQAKEAAAPAEVAQPHVTVATRTATTTTTTTRTTVDTFDILKDANFYPLF